MSIAGTIQFPGLASTPSPPPSGNYVLYTRTDNTLNIEDSLGNVYTFGATSAITQLTGDISAIGPGSAVATINFVGGQSAANVASATTAYLAATNLNTPSTLVLRDSSGNFSAGIITAALNGNASTATYAVSAGTAVNFTGSLAGDVTGTQGATVVSYVDSYTAAAVGASVAATQAATSSNTASTIVKRDASGSFSANIITAALNGNASTATNATTAVNFTGSLSGDVTGTQTATSISSTTVTGKLLTGYVAGTNTPILSTDSVLIGFEKLQAQISATSGSAITSLTGDITATGPGAVVATVSAIQGTTVSGTTGTANVVFSNAPTITGLLSGGSASFSSTISASNFSGNSSGNNTGDVTATNTNSIDLAFTSGQTGLNASLNLSAAGPDAGYIPTLSVIKTDGLLVEVLAGTPVQIGTSNNIGSASSAARSDHVHSITSAIVLGLLLTGYTAGTNTPLSATNTLLQGFENLQAQISASVGSAITALTGDVTGTGPGATATTIQSIQSKTVSGTTGTGNVVFSANPTFTGTVSASAITATSVIDSSLTTGSVLFAGAGGLITQDNPNFYWNDTNFCLGIGTIPSSSVMIDGVNITGASKLVQMTGYGTGSTTGYRGRFARGTLGSPTATQSGDTLSAISGRGYGASQFAAASTGVINIIAGENFTNTSNATYLQFQATPTGSVTSSEHMRVAATGVTLGPQSSSTDIHQINGGLYRTTRTITGNLTVDTTVTDDIIFCNQSAGITVTLPIPTNGRTLTIVDISGNAQTNNITIARHASEMIEGLAASKVYQTNYGSLVLTADGTNWWTIG